MREPVRRVVVVGRGGAGKSTYARAVGERLGSPVIELDRHFWSVEQDGAVRGLSAAQWERAQTALAAASPG